MAGNFILKTLTFSDLHTAIRFPRIKWSPRAAHEKGTPINPMQPTGNKFQGWTVDTRQVLKDALAEKRIGNREGLPPHRYLEIGAWNGLSDAERTYVSNASWIDELAYPNAEGLGLKVLHPNARAQWPHNKRQALIEMLKIGSVSLEVYYQAGMEMA